MLPIHLAKVQQDISTSAKPIWDVVLLAVIDRVKISLRSGRRVGSERTFRSSSSSSEADGDPVKVKMAPRPVDMVQFMSGDVEVIDKHHKVTWYHHARNA